MCTSYPILKGKKIKRSSEKKRKVEELHVNFQN